MKSKFKILALGGLNENGKNAYIIETDKDMILIEAGSANFTNKALGIDIVTPDFDYVIKNQKKLRAIFISHGHLDQMGALSHILKKVKVDVYASKYTIDFLKFYVNKGDYKLLKEIKYNQALTLGEFTIDVFSLSHAIFGNFGFSVSVGNDAIVYATDYNFNQAENKFSRTDIGKVIEVTKSKNVLALMTECLSIENRGMASGNQIFKDSLMRYFEAVSGRIIISLYSSNLAGMTNIIKMAEKYDKKIVIIGRDLLNYVNIARNLNYINHKKDIFTRVSNINKFDNLIIVVSGLYAEPFTMLEKMSIGQHNLLTIKDTDNVLIASKPYDEIESDAQRILDTIARTECSITSMDINVPSHAYQEDIKMMINLVDPKLIIPIKGEFRKQNHMRILAQEIGKTNDEVLLLNNGDIADIYADYGVVTGDIKLNDMLISDDKNEQIDPILLLDRQLLAESGYVLVLMVFDKTTGKIVQKPEIVSGGLNSFDNDPALIKACQRLVINEIKKDFSNRELIIKIKNKISRYLQNNIGNTPMVLPVRMEIDPKRIKAKNEKK